jgi:hypothetical protein
MSQPTDTSPLIVAVVVMYNSGAEAVDCARRLLGQVDARVEVVIVDNGSADDSFDEAQQTFGDEPRVHVCRISPNRGFSGGANEGMLRAFALDPAYIWLLTDDLELDVSAGASLLAAMESDPTIGLAGPYIYFANDRGRIYYGGGDLGARGASHEHAGEVPPASADKGPVRDTGYVTGACLFFRAEALRRVGFMDESFWLYWEDADLSWRFTHAGWRAVVVPAASAWHDATDPTDRTMPVRARYAWRNELRFMNKHRVRPTAPMVVANFRHTVGLLRRGDILRARPLFLGTLDFVLGRSGPIKGSW